MFVFHLIFAPDAALLIGLGHPPNDAELARIDDPFAENYIITAVDGEKPERYHLAYADTVPVVLVKAGHHRFTFHSRHDDTQVKEVQADVKAGVEYQIVEDQAGGLKIVPGKP